MLTLNFSLIVYFISVIKKKVIRWESTITLSIRVSNIYYALSICIYLIFIYFIRSIKVAPSYTNKSLLSLDLIILCFAYKYIIKIEYLKIIRNRYLKN